MHAKILLPVINPMSIHFSLVSHLTRLDPFVLHQSSASCQDMPASDMVYFLESNWIMIIRESVDNVVGLNLVVEFVEHVKILVPTVVF